MPVAASKLSEVVEIDNTSATSRSPKRMIEPLPNFFSMFRSAASTALPRSALNFSAIAPITFFVLSS